MKKERLVIGIDVGGTSTKIGLVNRAGKRLSGSRIFTSDYETPKDFVCAIAEEARGMEQHLGYGEIAAVGVGAPNGNYFSGKIEQAPNLKWKGEVPLVELFRECFPGPVVLTNDANAAAVGEWRYGAAKGMRNFIVITIGTGLGSGLVVNGQLLHGANGFAGEIGHTTAFQDGRMCGCGRPGCLETYVSARGLRMTLLELLDSSTADSLLRGQDPSRLSAKKIFLAAEAGDQLACEAFEITGRILGRKLADSVAHTAPEAIILAGGLALAGDYILAPARKHMEAHLLNIFKGQVKIIPSVLGDENPAILGAAAMAWDILDNPPD